MNEITVKSVKARGSHLKIDFERRGQIGKFFRTGRFYADYNTSVQDAPEEILAISFLGSVLPIVWANHAVVSIDRLDENFLKSMEAYKKSLQKLYPKLSLGGKLVAENVSKQNLSLQTKSMMLFSGGVDSLATYVRHKNEHPTFVCIHGGDISLRDEKAWKNAVSPIADFAHSCKVPLRTVQSNFRDMIDPLMIRVFDDYINETDNWYGRIMHGLSMLCLCAPIAFVQNIGKIYIAATYTSEFSSGWGSLPSLDNKVKWTGTKVIHDGYELSRQEKLFAISEFVKGNGKEIMIRSCFDSATGNCGQCEKCSRTILGLELAGLDPNKYGFTIKPDTFLHIKRELLNGRWAFGDDQMFMWEDIKRHAHLENNIIHPEAKSIISWLEKMDVSYFRTKSESAHANNLGKRLALFLRYVPTPLYRISRKYYDFGRKLSLPFLS